MTNIRALIASRLHRRADARSERELSTARAMAYCDACGHDLVERARAQAIGQRRPI